MLKTSWWKIYIFTNTRRLSALLLEGLMATSDTKGGTQKFPKQFKIVKTYGHDHSLESSRGALSDGTTSFSSNFWEKMHFLNFSQKTMLTEGEIYIP
jgi:hypothetical protein